MNSILRDKAKEYARQTIFLSKKMRETSVDFSIISQVIRSGTSIGANIHEAKYAQSMKDFVTKLTIALKECSESFYWIELLYDTGFISDEDNLRLSGLCSEIEKLLVSSIKTSKAKITD